MMKIKNEISANYLKYLLFLTAIVLVSFLSYRKAFEFDFWRDDWGQLWAATVHPELLRNVWATVKLHPISAYEQIYLVKFFGLNPHYWQIWGYVLKILSSLTISLFVFGMSRSKKAAIYSGILYASFLGGIESFDWVSAHTSALIIPPLMLGMYFWIQSFKEKSFSLYFISFFFFIFIIFGDPARGMSIVVLALFWDLLCLYAEHSVRSVKFFLVRCLPLFLFPILLKPFLVSLNFPSFSVIAANSYAELQINPNLIKNFLYSLGNLLLGWIIKIQDLGGLSNPSVLSLRASIGFFIFIAIVIINYLKKKGATAKSIIYASFWIILLYIPNWLFDKTLVVGTSHRYLALSAVGVPILIGVILSRIKGKRGILLYLAVVLLSIYSTNRILTQEWNHRSVKIVEPLWDKVNKDVPQGEKNSIFMYGGSYLEGVAMGWSFSMPYGIRRGMTDVDDFPIVTGDEKNIIDLLCKDNVYRPSISRWSYQKERIPISHLHAWEFRNGILTNISKEKRLYFTKVATCKVLP